MESYCTIALPWLLLGGQFALILFITCCFYVASHLLKPLLIYLRFALSTGTFDGNQTAIGLHKSQRIVTSVYCPPSATVDVAPQSCCHETGLCWHTHTLTHPCIHSFTHLLTVAWVWTCDIYEARAKENHFILQVSINKSTLTHPFWLPILFFLCPFNHYIIKAAGCIVPKNHAMPVLLHVVAHLLQITYTFHYC